MTCLVTGATGNIGGRVVERLLAAGERPRLLVRDAARARARFGERVAIVAGELRDAAALRAALDGIEALFLVTSGSEIEAHDARAAEAARAAGVQHLVKLSSLDARRAGGSAVGAWHARGEAAIRDRGLAFTFLQPAGFMSNALAWAPAIRAEGVVRASTGDGRVAMLHPDDLADVAAAVLLARSHVGESLALTGPEALSYAEMIAMLGATIGRPLDFQPISDAQALEQLRARGLPLPVAEALVALWRAVREGQVAIVTDTVERVLGRAPRCFAAWAHEHAEAFR
jgi:uncharacterized protein YbjT (DUF2867 family)